MFYFFFSPQIFKALLEGTDDKDKRLMLETIIEKTETSINNAENKTSAEGEDKQQVKCKDGYSSISLKNSLVLYDF